MNAPISGKRCVPAALLVAALASALAAEQPTEVWITLGQKEAQQLKSSLARHGHEQLLQVESEGAIFVARIPRPGRRVARLLIGPVAGGASGRTPYYAY